MYAVWFDDDEGSGVVAGTGDKKRMEARFERVVYCGKPVETGWFTLSWAGGFDADAVRVAVVDDGVLFAMENESEVLAGSRSRRWVILKRYAGRVWAYLNVGYDVASWMYWVETPVDPICLASFPFYSSPPVHPGFRSSHRVIRKLRIHVVNIESNSSTATLLSDIRAVSMCL